MDPQQANTFVRAHGVATVNLNNGHDTLFEVERQRISAMDLRKQFDQYYADIQRQVKDPGSEIRFLRKTEKTWRFELGAAPETSGEILLRPLRDCSR